MSQSICMPMNEYFQVETEEFVEEQLQTECHDNFLVVRDQSGSIHYDFYAERARARRSETAWSFFRSFFA